MSNSGLFSFFSKNSGLFSLLFLSTTIGFLSLYLMERSQKVKKGLAPLTSLVSQKLEEDMIKEYDRLDPSGNPAHPYKIALNGQEGIYQDLDVLLPQLNTWYYDYNIRYVDFRFSIVQGTGANAGKFTTLVIPVKSAVVGGVRGRIPHDGTVYTRAVDLGDLHP